MFRTSFFNPSVSEPEIMGRVTLGNASINVPWCKLPDQSGYFRYFKLNDHPTLVDEGARLIAERIDALGLNNPIIVTPEASTLALAHVLRSQYKIPCITLYKNKQLNDLNPLGIRYKTVTATDEKTLFIDERKKKTLQGREIIIMDSICTTGGTIKAVYDLLLKAGINASQIKEATMLFNEGTDIHHLEIAQDTNLSVHRFGFLPLVQEPSAEHLQQFSL